MATPMASTVPEISEKKSKPLKLPISGNSAHQKLPRVASKTKLVLLDFANAAVRFGYTIAAKLIFMARDLVICVLAVVHSAILIPLDFLLILFHSAAAFMQKNLFAKKREKWASTAAAPTGQGNSIPECRAPASQQKHDEGTRLFETQFLRKRELNHLRAQFWAGETVSLRNVVVKMGNNEMPTPQADVFLPSAMPRLRASSLSTSSFEINERDNWKKKLVEENVRKTSLDKLNRLPRVFGKHILSSRHISLLYRVVSGVHGSQNIMDLSTVASGPPYNNLTATTAASVVNATITTASRSEIKKISQPPELPPRDLLAVAPVPLSANLKDATKKPLSDFADQSTKPQPKCKRSGQLKTSKWLRHHNNPADLMSASTAAATMPTAVAANMAASTSAYDEDKDRLTFADQLGPHVPIAVTSKPSTSSINVLADTSTLGVNKIPIFDQPLVSFDEEDENSDSESDVEDPQSKSLVSKTQAKATNTKGVFENDDLIEDRKRHRIHYGRRFAKKLKAATVVSNPSQAVCALDSSAGFKLIGVTAAADKTLDAQTIYDNRPVCLTSQSLGNNLKVSVNELVNDQHSA